MKAVVLISESNPEEIQWKFDQVIAMIAFDIDLSVVFISSGCTQLQSNKTWKCLSIYGVENVYVMSSEDINTTDALFKVTQVSQSFMHKLIITSEIIL